MMLKWGKYMLFDFDEPVLLFYELPDTVSFFVMQLRSVDFRCIRFCSPSDSDLFVCLKFVFS